MAIRSFLMHYPELKDNIYYFDDESTDGTVELLSKLGVNRISWEKDLKNKYTNYFESGVIERDGQCLMLRCDYIFKSCIKHCQTKYALLLDGDTVTMSDTFLQEYVSNNNVINGVYGYMHTPVDYMEKYGIPRYEDFKVLLESEEIHYTEELGFDYVKHLRFHPYHIFIDMERLGDVSQIYRNLDDLGYMELFKRQYIDVGADLLLHCMQNDLKYSMIYPDEFVHHWTWVSSCIRDIEHMNVLDNKYVINRIVEGLKNKSTLRKVLKRLEVKPRNLIKQLQVKMRTGDYN